MSQAIRMFIKTYTTQSSHHLWDEQVCSAVLLSCPSQRLPRPSVGLLPKALCWWGWAWGWGWAVSPAPSLLHHVTCLIGASLPLGSGQVGSVGTLGFTVRASVLS